MQEWIAIKPMLPNKPRCVRRVDDRRLLDAIVSGRQHGATVRPKSRGLCVDDQLVLGGRPVFLPAVCVDAGLPGSSGDATCACGSDAFRVTARLPSAVSAIDEPNS